MGSQIKAIVCPLKIRRAFQCIITPRKYARPTYRQVGTRVPEPKPEDRPRARGAVRHFLPGCRAKCSCPQPAFALWKCGISELSDHHQTLCLPIAH